MGPDACSRNPEPHEIDFPLGELELGGVNYNAIAAAPVQKLAGTEKLLLDGVVKQEGVIHASPVPLEVAKEPVHPVHEAVPTRS